MAVTLKVVEPAGVEPVVTTLNDDVRLVLDVAVSGFVPNRGLAPEGRAVVPKFAVQLGLATLKVPPNLFGGR